MENNRTQDLVAEKEFISLVSRGQGFCIDINYIREIRRWTTVTPLPNAPSYILGVMNLRGAVIPIFDLSMRVANEQTEITSRSVVVVANIADRTVGLLVDAVSEILSVSDDTILPNPTNTSDTTSGQITGLISTDDEMLRVLNLDDLFLDEEGIAA